MPNTFGSLFRKDNKTADPNAVKQKVEVVQDTSGPAVQVVTEKAGPVTFFDKIKNYYKGLIATIGAILVVLNQATPVFNFLGPDLQGKFTAIVSVITAVSVFLKANEKYVDSLP